MKKNILFVTFDLDSDGAAKSLISALENIDYSKFNVDLLLMSHRGLFMSHIPKEVKVLPQLQPLPELTMPLGKAIGSLLSKKQIGPIIGRFNYIVMSRLGVPMAQALQRSWSTYSRYISTLEKRYDAAISYQDYWAKYFIVEKVCANIKIAWNHCNLSKTSLNIEFENRYNASIDHWVTISEDCKRVLNSMFPNMINKTIVIENIISPLVISSMSKKERAFVTSPHTEKRIVTVGRLAYEKGIDLAIKSCKLLIELGYDIKWYVIGEGQQRPELEHLIKKYGLEEKFILLGLKSNPYPYVAAADIYVQPSRTEGKSIAIEEAKAIGKPIVVTNYQTVASQIEELKTGLIAPVNAEGIFERVKELLDNPELIQQLSHNLQKYRGNESEIEKLYKIIECKYTAN